MTNSTMAWEAPRNRKWGGGGGAQVLFVCHLKFQEKKKGLY